MEPESNERGSYGDRRERSSALGIAIVLGATALIYGLSPGALHYYKHGFLPRARSEKGR